METPTMSIPAVEDQAATSAAPQGTEPGAQVPAQHQEAASSQVETRDFNASSQEEARRASDYETARHMKQLVKEFRSLKTALEKSSQSPTSQASPQPQSVQFTNEEFLKDPASALRRLIQAEVQGIRTEIPQQFQQLNEVNRHEAARQEALRLIKTNKAVGSDPEGRERMEDILNEEDEFGNSLEKYSQTNPRHAAQLALMEYKNRFGGGASRQSQSAPTKAQMLNTATAVNAGMPKSTLDQEAAQLYRMVLDDPNLMSKPEFMAKLDAFKMKSQMEAAVRPQ